jgi:alkanesulfonate monooxygenase SsuD/methylene tetrahydromethanopterin reductase-like flavin-dependent oxidoreductase (luciferase family)
MNIKFGIYYDTLLRPDDNLPKRIDEFVEQARIAKDNGFSSLSVGQHILTEPFPVIATIPLLARLVPEAEGMHFIANVLVLPILNPFAVAEESATMDLLTSGKFILGVGLGYREEEYQAFNVKRAERVNRLVEGIEIIRRLWTEPSLTYHGQFYNVTKVGMGTRRVRRDSLPIWIAASMDPAIERAAILGDAWIITFYPSLAMLTRQMMLYHQVLEAEGKPIPNEKPIMKECYISPNHKTALDECKGPLGAQYQAYHSWGQDSFLPAEEKFNQPFEEFAKNRFLIGDPEYVLDEIERYHETLGVNHFILRIQWAGLEQKTVIRTIKLLGQNIISKLG